jgi:hypothetical protein
MSVIGTDLQATARVNDCLAAPNASSPQGQQWTYRINRQNNRKCWYLHATLGLLHRPAKPSDLHAASSAAGAPTSGSSADSGPRLPNIRKLVVKRQPAPLVSTMTKETIQQSDAPSISQEFPLQGSTPQVDRSQPVDVIAAPGSTPEGATLGMAVADADAVAHPDIPREIAHGEFSTLHTWLRDNVYQHGSKFAPNDLIERVTDTAMSMTPYLGYLHEKYAALYWLPGSLSAR